MRSPAPGRELVRLGALRRTLADAGSIGERPTRRSAGTVEAGSAGRSRAGAAQACQIAQPDARDRGISHLAPLPPAVGGEERADDRHDHEERLLAPELRL